MIELSDLASFVERGWKVFPVFKIVAGECVCRKGAACASPGKHPMLRNGVNGASDDLDQIALWHSIYPHCNWAVATGEPSGVWVLDIDQHGQDGVASLNEWLAENSVTLPQTFTVYTGGGGWHLYFLMEGKTGNRGGVLPGVDVRGTGGYVLLPGSGHVSGREYLLYSDAREAVPVRRLIDLANAPRSSGPRSGGVNASPSTDLARYIQNGFTPGNRDNECYHLACSLWRKHWNDPEFVEAAIADCWRATPDHETFPWSQAKRKIAEAHKFIGRKKDEEDTFIRLHGGAA
ncbi:bifunctional DNA primase/polymerase [Microbacterium arborescens]